MLQNWLNPQIEYLLFLQNIREITGGVFDNFFLSITSFGEITIPILFIAGIYWCINTRYGSFILWNWGCGFFISEFLKSLFCIYRPWVLDSRIQPPEKAFYMSGGYSFPSGHTQTAVSVWGGMIYCFKNKFLSVILFILIILVAFSRNYLGVHTPQDVIVSIIVAVFMLFFMEKLMSWTGKGKNRDILIFFLAILLSLLLILFEHFKSYPMDYVDGKLLVNPNEMRLYAFPKIGLFLGIFSGWLLNNRFLKFDGSIGSIKEKIIRFFIGSFLLIVIAKCARVFFNLFLQEKYALLCTAYLATFFVIYLYPLVISYVKKFFNIESICQNQHHQNSKEV